ncbi:MAG: Crp/Fnr family transcriptional regulator [Ferruginibacter sp.]|nr:Crp/Fnr family transcriptional regulator [Ferruginibacter sp.]
MTENTTCDSTLLLIRGFDIFEHITEDEYEELKLVHNFIEAAKGEYIYFPNQNHNKLYFTKEGYIKLGYIDNEGKEVIKEIIQKGEVFGQLTLERHNEQDEFAQACKTNVSLCAFNIHDFVTLLQKKPGMALAFSFHLGNKLHKVENRLLNILNKDVRTRLIQFLLQLSAKDGKVVAGNTASLERFLSHDDIAKLIGSTRQTVTTLLNQLRKEKLITISKSNILINDIAFCKKITS